MARHAYDEFSLFHENAEEWGLPYESAPVVRRTTAVTEDGRSISSLAWGDGPASLVLLHGGAQNAHTYDTVALALDRPLLAIDLPGHGHSDSGRPGAARIESMAQDVLAAIEQLAAPPVALVGMSLGGMVAMAAASQRPDLVARLALIDITPGVNSAKAGHITAFINGPNGFASLDELLERTIEHNPTRSVESLRRGILHNAVQLDDGSWVWRWARHGDVHSPEAMEPSSLWELLGGLEMPLMLVRGMAAGSVVDDADEAQLRSLRPDARVERVEGAGHSVQGDQPIVLADLLEDFVG